MMKIVTIVVLLITLLQIKRNKLDVVVANEKENILTLDIENPLTALIQSTSKKGVV